jgi:hypothetical protein
MHRESFGADAEVIREYCRGRLKGLDLEDHQHYINQVAIDLKRELRICRDVYAEYLRTVNNKSIITKARVALDFAVAPRASRRLREETIVYVRHLGVSDLMFAVLFYRIADRLLMLRDYVPQWLALENVVIHLIPDNCFQEIKEATSREIGSLATGPFGNPAQPFDRLVISLTRGEKSEWKRNAIWDDRNILLSSGLWELWNFVFREICDQHAAIDCEEQSNLARALIALNPFELLAGRMFCEESERDTNRVPDDVFIKMGRQLDREHIPLADNLDSKGRAILKNLGQKGKPITKWEIALADKREQVFLPVTIVTHDEATILKQFGTLSRSAKRAFYRAKDAYRQALEQVYEERTQAPIPKNPFGSRL